VPAVVVVAVLAIAAFAGAEAFNVANGDLASRPAAPIGAFLVWMLWFLPLAAAGTFLTLLSYLLVLPARSRGLWITQIVLTSLAALFTLVAVALAFVVMKSV
jgi:hypothetical protein